jgi:hypothetical protein
MSEVLEIPEKTLSAMAPHFREGMRLRMEALALLQQAEAIDHLKPHVVTIADDVVSTFITWDMSKHLPMDEVAAQFGLDCDQTKVTNVALYGLTLAEMTGVKR